MFKNKHNYSPPKHGNPNKRYHESQNSHKPNKVPKTENETQEEPRFTFEEVKLMIEKILEKASRSSAAVSAGLKRVDFDEIAVEGHSVQGCKELIEQLVQNTRRVRTLQEVLIDIKENLKKRVYTEIIQRATLTEQLPRKPPSAYLLYHQDRYNELRAENSLAVEVSKIVAEEWKVLPEDKRRKYFRRHENMLRKYDEEMQRLGLVNESAPKRPRSAKALFIEAAMNQANTEDCTKEEISAKKEYYGQAFECLDPVEKQKWIQLHKENVDRYQKERDEYIAAHPHLDHAGPDKKPRSNERIKAPEQPRSAFKFYCEKKLPEMLEGDDPENAKKRLKEKFAHLRERKMLKYIKKAIQDKERYEVEAAEFKRRFPERDLPKVKANVTKDQYKLYSKVVENRPRLPAPTAYLHFCGKLLSEMQDSDDTQVIPTRRMQVASTAWKCAPAKLKKQNEREHIDDVERYICEMEAWLAGQTEERKRQLALDEPKANPDYWRKKLNKFLRAERRR